MSGKIYVARANLRVSKKDEPYKICKVGEVYDGPDAKALLASGLISEFDGVSVESLQALEKKILEAKRELSETKQARQSNQAQK